MPGSGRLAILLALVATGVLWRTQTVLDPPQQLWHALTIYTTWKVTKRELRPKPGVPYTPDADADVRFERNGWEKLRVALDKDWQPYLDG